MISFIYFDLGGVVIKDFSGTNKWNEMKEGMGITGKNIAVFDAVWQKYRDRVCIDFDVDNLIAEIEKACQVKLPNKYSMLDDFVARFEENIHIKPVLEKISQKHKVGLLTNVYPRMFKKIQQKGLLPQIKWEVIIDSSVVGFQKPDRAIFEIAEKQAHVKKSQILFVDNQSEHVKAAAEFGWQTFFYETANPFESSKKLPEFINKNN